MMKKSRGVALVLVICAMALVVALGTAALVAANSGFATSVDNTSQQQAYLAACSYCEVLKDRLLDSTDSLTQRVDMLTSGQSLTLTADSSAAGNLGTAQCTFTRTGDVLDVTVDALYNGEHNLMGLRMTKVASDWVFDAFRPVN